MKSIIKFILKGNDNAIRGRQYPPSRYENDFWERFIELLSDDPEDPYNEIVGILRDSVMDYFKDHNL